MAKSPSSPDHSPTPGGDPQPFAAAPFQVESAGQLPAGAPGGLAGGLLAKIAAMRFWTFSAVFHVILVILVGGTVMFEAQEDPPDFASEGGLMAGGDDAPPPAQQTPQLQQMQPTIQTTPTTTATNSSKIEAIVSSVPTAGPTLAPTFQAPAPKASMGAELTKIAMPSMSGTGLSKDAAKAIGAFTGGWAKNAMGGRGKSLQQREFEFTAYLAKYAGGDWDSTVRIENGLITEGSLPNLLYVMSKLSRDKVAGRPQAKPLDLASQELFEKKPPFVFFTGHRDFVLTDKEIANLRNYIIVGGCIWGDSSLAGQRSRFDIAFRREMKRVINDVNKQWKEMPATHPIFSKNYFPDIKEQPEGINYYKEPVYVLEGMAGEIGVIYTANNYGDMFQFGIDENGVIDLSRDERRRMIAVNEVMWWRRNLYFRNIDSKPLLKCYKFGMNVVIHLMTRFEDKLKAAGVQPAM